MPCVCEKCGCICDCGERLCNMCFIDTLDDPVEKNLAAGGKFYDEGEDVTTEG
jgi:hypothetical protein